MSRRMPPITASTPRVHVVFLDIVKMALRLEIAARESIPPYNVLGQPVLRELALRRPTNYETLMKVDGISEKKAADFGAELIEVRAVQDGAPHDPPSRPSHTYLLDPGCV